MQQEFPMYFLPWLRMGLVWLSRLCEDWEVTRFDWQLREGTIQGCIMGMSRGPGAAFQTEAEIGNKLRGISYILQRAS